MHPQILALGLKLPLTKFVRSVLSHFRITLSQLSGVAWRTTVLGFEALLCYERPICVSARGLLHHLRSEEDQSGCPLLYAQSGREKLIVNMVDNNHVMHNTVIHVSDPWEAESEEWGAIPTTWNLGLLARRGVTLSLTLRRSCRS